MGDVDGAAHIDLEDASPIVRLQVPEGKAVLARADAHRLRAESDAVLVGAGTVKTDDPELTVRLVPTARQPLRVVLGHAPAGARCQPALELGGDLGDVLDELGRRDVLQLLVEGGAHVAGSFHRAGLVDRYIFYIAPALFGGDDARPMFAGAGAATMADLWRGRWGGNYMTQRDAEARRARVLAAMKSPGSAATRELVGLLADDDPLVREWAIEGLTRRKDRDDAVPDLVKRLVRRSGRESQVYFRVYFPREHHRVFHPS